jgi:alpha-beta hydrolase superfamily lysophospholipase/predicted GNAT family N-acyltransferase
VIGNLQLSVGTWEALRPQASMVRRAVFVVEQGIAEDLEWDDSDPASLHCIAQVDGELAGTGRLLPDGHIGRMAVLPRWRGRGVGGAILERLIVAACERGHESVELSAQVAVRAFYERHAFVALGEVYQEVGIAHQRMRREIGDRARSPSGAAARSLRIRRWRARQPHGGGIYVLHGLGEHGGRYDALARWLCDRGWTVGSHDHLGHGESDGRRGIVDVGDRLSLDARERVAAFAREIGQPPVLLGHSLGGAVAADLVASRGLPVAALVLSSPALALRVGRPMRAIASLLARLAPDLALPNGLDPARLSSDPAVVAAYRADPAVHDRISPRLFAWLAAAGEQARAAAQSVRVPVLLLVAGDDAMVDPEGSRAFAQALSEGPGTLHVFERLRHELFNEAPAGRDRVLAVLEPWLAARVPRAGG